MADRKTRRSAARAGVSWRDRLRGLRAQHRHHATDSLKRIWATPVAALMTWAVIGIALALPTGLYLLVENISALGGDWHGGSRITLYLREGAAPDAIATLAERVRDHPQVRHCEWVAPEQGLAEFGRLTGLGDVLTALEDNPLPHVLVVTLNDPLASLAVHRELAATWSAVDLVEDAVVDAEWLQRLHALVALARRLAIVLGAVLATAVLLVVGNTLRLAVASRQTEVEVVKLVGGTNAFIRRPFLYMGLWYGFGGGVLAVTLVEGTMLWIDPVVTRLAGLYGSGLELLGLGFAGVLVLCGLAMALGLTGAWLSVGRHIRAAEPG